MYQASTEFASVVSQCARTFYAKIKSGSDIIAYGIKSIKHNGGSNGDDDIKIGGAFSAYIEAEISDPDIMLENKEIEILTGLQLANSIEYIRVGYFTVKKPEKSGKILKITAYDRMNKADSIPYFSNLVYPTTAIQMLDEICTLLRISRATTGLGTIVISTKKDGFTCREMLGYLASLYGKFACINRDGKLEIRWYEDNSYTVGPGRYVSLSTNEKDFMVNKIDCSVDNSTTLTTGSGYTGISIANPLMTQDRLNSIFSVIGNYTYRPGACKFFGDPRLDPWDVITVTDLFGSSCKIPCMALTQEFDGGISTTVGAVGKTEEESKSDFKGPTTKAIERTYTELMLVNVLMADKVDAQWVESHTVSTIEFSAVRARVDELEVTTLTVTSANLRYATIDLANIAVGSITTAMIGQGAIGTVQISDGSITDAKIVDLTANKITAGKLDAANITVVNLDCASLTVGTINGVQITDGAITTAKLAAAVNDSITTAQSTADGKNTIYYASVAPSGGSYKVNDLWFNTSLDNTVYYWSGTAWVVSKFGNNAISNIDAGKITAGYISASRIQAGTITGDMLVANTIAANKIAIGDPTNYATVNEYLPSSMLPVTFFKGQTITNGSSISKGIATNASLMLCDYTQNTFTYTSATDFDEIYFQFTIKSANVATLRVYLYGYDVNKVNTSSYLADSNFSITSTATVCKSSIKLNTSTINSNVYFILGIEDTSSTKMQLYVSNAIFRRKSTTTSIKDGVITTEKIVASAITAAKINVSDLLVSGLIGANKITATNLNVSMLSSISANLGTLTAGILQSSNYVPSVSGMKLTLDTGTWDSKYFKIATDGSIVSTAGNLAGFTINVKGLSALSSETFGPFPSNYSDIMRPFILGTATPTATELALYDIDGDGKITSLDMIYVNRMYNGIWPNVVNAAFSIVPNSVRNMIVLERTSGAQSGAKTILGAGNIFTNALSCISVYSDKLEAKTGVNIKSGGLQLGDDYAPRITGMRTGSVNLTLPTDSGWAIVYVAFGVSFPSVPRVFLQMRSGQSTENIRVLEISQEGFNLGAFGAGNFYTVTDWFAICT